MEFPNLGKNCKFSGCNKIDFLPAECSYCSLNYCTTHLYPSNHKCEKVFENVVDPTKQTPQSFNCSFEKCITTGPLQMICVKCSEHFCLLHRYHSCFDVTPSQARRQKERAPKEQFKKAKQESDKIVEEKLKNAKNRAMANKIKLMRVRGFAQGDNSIPTSDRRFFCVCPPLLGADTSQSRALFVSKTWTLGRCVDSLSKRLKLNNKNLELDADKLRLFTCDGQLLGPLQDTLFLSYLEDDTLIDGDNLILEFISQRDLDSNVYSLPTFQQNKHKYVWTKTLKVLKQKGDLEVTKM